MNRRLQRGTKVLILAGSAAAFTTAAFFLPRIPQDPAYHRFADARSLLGIPNLLNVVSNLPLAVVGVLGLFFVARRGSHPEGPFTQSWERWSFGALFAGVGLTAFGSGYYHLAPDNARLFWDRLPMTVGFMSILAATIAERVSLRAGRLLLAPLLAAGGGSVIYWRQTELAGAGDLRFYGLVQFFPLLAIGLMLLLFPARYTRAGDLLVAGGWYALAKVCELLDARIFALGELVSGHTLKHLAAGVAVYWILRMLRARRPIAAA